MGLRQVVFGSCLLAVALAAPACGSGAGLAPPVPAVPAAGSSCASRSGFAVSLVPGREGQPAPAAAAAWFARHGGVPGIPDEGWRQASRNGSGAIAGSGQVILHAVQGPDRTWRVDSGSRCS